MCVCACVRLCVRERQKGGKSTAVSICDATKLFPKQCSIDCRSNETGRVYERVCSHKLAREIAVRVRAVCVVGMMEPRASPTIAQPQSKAEGCVDEFDKYRSSPSPSPSLSTGAYNGVYSCALALHRRKASVSSPFHLLLSVSSRSVRCVCCMQASPKALHTCIQTHAVAHALGTHTSIFLHLCKQVRAHSTRARARSKQGSKQARLSLSPALIAS